MKIRPRWGTPRENPGDEDEDEDDVSHINNNNNNNNNKNKNKNRNNNIYDSNSVVSEDELVNQIFERNYQLEKQKQERLEVQKQRQRFEEMQNHLTDINDKTATQFKKVKHKFKRMVGKEKHDEEQEDHHQHHLHKVSNDYDDGDDDDDDDSWANNVEVVADYNTKNQETKRHQQHDHQRAYHEQYKQQQKQQQQQDYYDEGEEKKNYYTEEEEEEEYYNRIPNTTMTPTINYIRTHSNRSGTDTTNNTTSSSNTPNVIGTSAAIATKKSTITLSPPNKSKCFTETRLFKAIEDREWRSAIVRVRHSPIEASMWVSSGSTTTTTNTTHTSTHKMLNNNDNITTTTKSNNNNKSNDNTGQNIMSGKLLPIHCACVQQAPLIVFKELLKALPTSARARDSNGNLPLHYAVRFGVNDVDILDLLLASYPESTGAMDCDGLTAIVIAVNCTVHPNKDEVVNALSKDIGYYANREEATASLSDEDGEYDYSIGHSSSNEEGNDDVNNNNDIIDSSPVFSSEKNHTFIPPTDHRPTPVLNAAAAAAVVTVLDSNNNKDPITEEQQNNNIITNNNMNNGPIWNKNGLSIVIIGASNEITRKKIFPSLFNLFCHNLLPSDVIIWSLGKSSYNTNKKQQHQQNNINNSHLAFREKIKSSLRTTNNNTKNYKLDAFLSKLFYHQLTSYDDMKSYQKVSDKISKHEDNITTTNNKTASGSGGVLHLGNNRLFFMCVSSHLFYDVGCMLKQSSLWYNTTIGDTGIGAGAGSSNNARKGWCRIMLENWVGCSLDTVEDTMRRLHANFDDKSLFRVDHYLGKEQIRNLLFVRFSNILFDNIWNRDHIQCIIISYKQKYYSNSNNNKKSSSSKDNSDKKSKAQYTDVYGIIKDIVQNHLMNIVTLLTMEPPRKIDGIQSNEEIHKSKISILESIPSISVDDCLLGQYENYVPPDNVNTPNTLTPSGIATSLSNMPATTTARSSDDTTNVTTSTTSSNSSSTLTIEDVIQNTPTYALLRCFIRTPRWENVPIILQAATGVDEDVEEIKIQFKNMPSIDFLLDDSSYPLPRNELVFRSNTNNTIDNTDNKNNEGNNNESITIKTNCKAPGDGIFTNTNHMTNDNNNGNIKTTMQQMLTKVDNPTGFALNNNNSNNDNEPSYFDPDPYTRCIMDVLRNKHGVGFMNQDEILQTWHIFLPLYQSFFHQYQLKDNKVKIQKYAYGSNGPDGINEWIRRKSGYKSYDGSIVDTIATTTTSTNIARSLSDVEEKKEMKKNIPSKPEETEDEEEPDIINTANKISSSPKVKTKKKLISKSGEYDIGVFGLTPFGQTLVLNMASNGYKVCVGSSKQSRLDSTLRRVAKELHDDNIIMTARTAQEFISNLSIPRKVILIGISSKPIDGTISALVKLLDKGDIIIDTGIEWYSNCLKRFIDIENKGILYMNLATSIGGDTMESMIPASSSSSDPLTSCNNTCFMFSGPKQAYDIVYDIFKGCAMIHPVDAKPCIGYIGNIGSVNYTKMVQNGIEYGFMQLLSEIYDIMKHIMSLHNEDMSFVFQKWNACDELKAFLIEITSIILRKKDSKSRNRAGRGARQEFVVDNILDKVNMKGIGKFIMQEASDQNQELSTINASLDSRFVCAKKSVREVASKILKGPSIEQSSVSINDDSGDHASNSNNKLNIKTLKDALYASLICLYSQGFSLLSTASDSKGFDLDLAMIAKLLNIGSPIQSNLLNEIYNSFQESSASLHLPTRIDEKSASIIQASLPNFPNDIRNNNTELFGNSHIMLSPTFSTILNESIPNLRKVIVSCVEKGIACPALSSSLSYFDSLRRNNLPANLIQAQRNFIGGHPFERIDRPGVYRCAWTEFHHKAVKVSNSSKGKNKTKSEM